MNNQISDQNERLQKFLAKAGISSRRGAEEIILAGRVKVNGHVITELGTKVTASDVISVDGKIISGPESLEYYLFYKPVGVITSAKDPQGRKTVLDFFKDIKSRIYPVGRLDYDTSGLLLLTNDGELANRLIHPRYGVNKTYHATVKGKISNVALETLRTGVKLEDGKTAPAQVNLIKPNKDGHSVIELTIHEGKNRQIRRMCAAVGFPVLNLERIKFGQLTLGNLKPGNYRPLLAEEIQALRLEVDINYEG